MKKYTAGMSATHNDLVSKHAQRRISRTAAQFDGADFVHRRVFDALMERLSPLVIEPRHILDLGAATGCGSRSLAKMYRKGRVVSVDLSAAMLHSARRKKSFFSKLAELCGNALQLPLRSGSVDFVCANLLLPWIDDLAACLKEIARVLKKDGVFAFSTLGPDSFVELRRAWGSSDSFAHVRDFPDMHDIGDGLLQSGLADPVLDVDHLSVTYKDTAALYRDLTATGARNSLVGRRRSLTTKRRLSTMEKNLAGSGHNDLLTITLELVYGHAFSTGPRPAAGEFRLDADSIGRRTRR